MTVDQEDPRCPECGGPIGQTATYCMHCSADLAGRHPPTPPGDGSTRGREGTEPADIPLVDHDGPLLDPDGLVDNTLTAIVGIVGGLVVGLLGTIVLVVLTGSGWAVVLGVLVWLAATAYLVRRRTVQAAVAQSGYAAAIVLVAVPLVALSPLVEVDGGLGERIGLLVVLVFFVAVPAAVAVVVGWIASRYVPESPTEE